MRKSITNTKSMVKTRIRKDSIKLKREVVEAEASQETQMINTMRVQKEENSNLTLRSTSRKVATQGVVLMVDGIDSILKNSSQKEIRAEEEEEEAKRAINERKEAQVKLEVNITRKAATMMTMVVVINTVMMDTTINTRPIERKKMEAPISKSPSMRRAESKASTHPESLTKKERERVVTDLKQRIRKKVEKRELIKRSHLESQL